MPADRLPRRDLLRLAGLGILSAGLTACSSSASVATPTTLLPPPASPEPTTEPAIAGPDEALARLREGNQRFVADKEGHPNSSPSRRTTVAAGQQPFATILGCVDSRVPPELIFDRGLGDLFVIRTAGHTLDRAVTGSIEFGAAELKIPLILVLGHERCGAVKATIDFLGGSGEAPGDIAMLVEAITPAVEAARARPGDLLDNAVEINVTRTIATLRTSSVLAGLIAQGKAKITGAVYDLDTGAVRFL